MQEYAKGEINEFQSCLPVEKQLRNRNKSADPPAGDVRWFPPKQTLFTV